MSGIFTRKQSATSKMFQVRFDSYIRKHLDVDYLVREDLVARLARMVRKLNFKKLEEHRIDDFVFMINYFMWLRLKMKLVDEIPPDIDKRLWDCFAYTFNQMTGYKYE
jgi:hypothetical protein